VGLSEFGQNLSESERVKSERVLYVLGEGGRRQERWAREGEMGAGGER
jgi:hypothetical protein